MLFGLNSPHWGWMFSLLASFLIIFFMRMRDPDNWSEKLGIHFNQKDIRRFIIITVFLSGLSYIIVNYVSLLSGYNFKPKLLYHETYLGSNYPFHNILANYLYYIPETFNEEILIGALLLMGVERKFKKLDKNYIVILVACVFSLMHQGLYKWSPVQPGELLALSTIITLFFVGVLRNSIILKTRNIAMSWAIHLSFNMVFFSGLFINVKNGKFPSEPEVFDIVFGNLIMVVVTGLLALASVLWLNSDKISKKN